VGEVEESNVGEVGKEAGMSSPTPGMVCSNNYFNKRKRIEKKMEKRKRKGKEREKKRKEERKKKKRKKEKRRKERKKRLLVKKSYGGLRGMGRVFLISGK